ncbi:Glutathione S-transferase zeta-1 [Dimargaris cristalligena]|nr:Glutathione S-transferase zeta-1 [Dimargaris cristalligena]
MSNEKGADIVLYSYFRSSSSARLRIALNWKKMPYLVRPINLLKGEQRSAEYAEINPNRSVPTLIVNDVKLVQSVAALEYLEDLYPESRAKIREIVQVIVSDIQPVQNFRVLQKVDQAERTEWAKNTIEKGFEALETMLVPVASQYCVGSSVTLADVCLAPQMWNAQRFGVDLDRFPTIGRVCHNLMELEEFRAAHWQNQPDCPPELKGQ